MTKLVTDLLLENNIYFVKVPNNMTHVFQPLDLTVNGHCKSYLKKQFAEWISRQFNSQLSLGKKAEEVEMKFPLTTIKPIHANWITQFYNHMSTEEGVKIIINVWKASGIFDAVAGGSANLPAINPFQDISPLAPVSQALDSHFVIPEPEMAKDFVNKNVDDESESEWEDDDEDEFERNAFDFIIDDEIES